MKKKLSLAKAGRAAGIPWHFWQRVRANLIPLAILLALAVLAGCSANQVLYEPSPTKRGLEPKIILDGEKTAYDVSTGIPKSDAMVEAFAADVEASWRRGQRFVGVAGVRSQIAQDGTVAIAGLSGLNAIYIPVIQGLGKFIGGITSFLDPRGKENAFKDGVAMLVRAKITFYDWLAENPTDNKTKTVTSGMLLSKAGSTWFRAVGEAIISVENALDNRVTFPGPGPTPERPAALPNPSVVTLPP